MVQPVVHDQFVHQRQGQRGVGPRAQLQVLMAFLGRLALARVDADQAGAVALGLLRDAPEMQVAADGVAAPDQDELGLGEELHLHSHLGTQRVHQAFAAGRGADGARQQRRAQAVEEAPVHALALHQSHGARVAVRLDGLRVARGDVRQARRDVPQRFVPAHRGELPAALGARTFEWREDALGMVGALGVLRHLGAQHAAGLRMRRVALYAHGAAVLHGGDQGAGIGAVVGAGAAHLVGGRSVGDGSREHVWGLW